MFFNELLKRSHNQMVWPGGKAALRVFFCPIGLQLEEMFESATPHPQLVLELLQIPEL